MSSSLTRDTRGVLLRNINPLINENRVSFIALTLRTKLGLKLQDLLLLLCETQDSAAYYRPAFLVFYSNHLRHGFPSHYS